MAKYRKRPVVVDAFKFEGTPNVTEEWFWDAVHDGTIVTFLPTLCKIKTPEGDMTLRMKDYIIRGVNGEIYPCKADVFEATYELVKGG